MWWQLRTSHDVNDRPHRQGSFDRYHLKSESKIIHCNRKDVAAQPTHKIPAQPPHMDRKYTPHH